MNALYLNSVFDFKNINVSEIHFQVLTPLIFCLKLESGKDKHTDFFLSLLQSPWYKNTQVDCRLCVITTSPKVRVLNFMGNFVRQEFSKRDIWNI